MQVEIKIDHSCVEPRVLIRTAAMTDEVRSIVNRLSRQPSRILSGSREEKVEVLQPEDLIRVYTVRFRLYEIEERLNADSFIRISNSEIINLNKVRNFDLNFTGTICVEFINHSKTYVSRRYVAKIKKILGI